MFKIILNAMWSKDYLSSLAQVLSTNMPCDLEVALQHLRDLAAGKRLTVMAATVGKAHELACDFLQYGCYIEVEQVAALTDAAMIADFQDWFDEDQSRFKVVTDAAGHVTKMIEEVNFAYLNVETPGLKDWVGAELLRFGAEQVEESDWPALNARLQQAIAENEVRRMDLRAERALEKRQRQDQNSRYPEED